jgi:hypothetical protein
MENYLKSALSVLFAVVFTEMQAQIKSEFVFGINLSTMTLKVNGISYDAETPVGIHFGRLFEIPLKNNFALQPSFLFSAKGSDYTIDTLSVSISPIYIEVPVNALFSFGSGAIKVSFFGGPYFACGIGGYKIESEGELKDIKYGSGENHDLKLFDIGLNLGTRLNICGLMISVQYGMGLINISPVTTFDTEMKNKVIGITISAGSKGTRLKTRDTR